MNKIQNCLAECDLFLDQNKSVIIVHCAKENNLKNICFKFPKNQIIVLTGPSGSGKSTIANEILQQECIRLYLEALGMTSDHIVKANVDKIIGLSPSIGISQRSTNFNPRSTVGTKTGVLTILRNMFAVIGNRPCNNCGILTKPPIQHSDNFIKDEIITTKDDSTSKKIINYYSCPKCNEKLEKLTMAHFSFNYTKGICDGSWRDY